MVVAATKGDDISVDIARSRLMCANVLDARAAEYLVRTLGREVSGPAIQCWQRTSRHDRRQAHFQLC